MCTKFHGATSAPHGGKGETGQGAKEKTQRKGGQHHSSQTASGVRAEPSIEGSPDGIIMKYGHDACDALVGAHESAGAMEKTPRKRGQHHSSPNASAVRSEPSIEGSPDEVLTKYGHDACDALVGAHESTGAKEVTLQKNPAKQTMPETSAIASNSMIGTISLSTAGSQPPQHDPENDPEKTTGCATTWPLRGAEEVTTGQVKMTRQFYSAPLYRAGRWSHQRAGLPLLSLLPMFLKI